MYINWCVKVRLKLEVVIFFMSFKLNKDIDMLYVLCYNELVLFYFDWYEILCLCCVIVNIYFNKLMIM